MTVPWLVVNGLHGSTKEWIRPSIEGDDPVPQQKEDLRQVAWQGTAIYLIYVYIACSTVTEFEAGVRIYIYTQRTRLQRLASLRRSLKPWCIEPEV